MHGLWRDLLLYPRCSGWSLGICFLLSPGRRESALSARTVGSRLEKLRPSALVVALTFRAKPLELPVRSVRIHCEPIYSLQRIAHHRAAGEAGAAHSFYGQRHSHAAGAGYGRRLFHRQGLRALEDGREAHALILLCAPGTQSARTLEAVWKTRSPVFGCARQDHAIKMKPQARPMDDLRGPRV